MEAAGQNICGWKAYMKKTWGYIVGIILGVVFIIWFGVFLFSFGKNKNSGEKENVSMEQLVDNSDNIENVQQTSAAQPDIDLSFYLVYEDGRVVIYREPERELYDYAEINMDSLPVEIREQLKLGLYIDGLDNLYDFLQAYSS